MQVLCYMPYSVNSISHIDLTNENVYRLIHTKANTLEEISIITLFLHFNLLSIILFEYFHKHFFVNQQINFFLRYNESNWMSSIFEKNQMFINSNWILIPFYYVPLKPYKSRSLKPFQDAIIFVSTYVNCILLV